ncbi:hypothetical protein [Ralstonia sp. UNC404CL21Col]|uniref:hypothetical protein n=1 Tax=Ralstonia sp. UNC404CL21Col TaxID=1380362 RepID=UPI0004873F90|nr:hypothetical protein [Ralstonia sp. UNC404CL21Col]
MKNSSALLAILLTSAIAVSPAVAQQIGPQDDDLLDVPLMAVGKPSTYLSSFVAQSFPAKKLRLDRTHSVSLKFRNAGTATWRAGEVVLVNTSGNEFIASAVGLPAMVLPGAEVQFDFQVRVPCIWEGVFPILWCKSFPFQYQLANNGIRFGDPSPYMSHLFESTDEGGGGGTPAPEPGMIDLPVPGGPPPSTLPKIDHPVLLKDLR